MKKPNSVSKRKCPICLETREYENRNETCSLACSQELRRRRIKGQPELSSQPWQPEAEPGKFAERKRPLEKQILGLLAKSRQPLGLTELANKADCSPAAVETCIAGLRDRGHNIQLAPEGLSLSGEVIPYDEEPLIVHNLASYKHRPMVFGATGDNHLGSKHERLDVLRTLYDVYEDEGVETVYNTGNWIEGESRLNRHDIKVFGLDRQIDYFLENYPEKKGIVTYFVAGDDHEGWYQRNEAINIGRYLQSRAEDAGRQDLKFLGYVEADIEFRAEQGSRWMKVMHPGGGAAYALSYASQKIVESFQGGEKPNILLAGHYHKFDYCFPREVHCVQTGCTVDQSIFMRKSKIQAHVGGVLCRMNQAPDGTINRFSVEWLPFYDRGFYWPKRRNFN